MTYAYQNGVNREIEEQVGKMRFQIRRYFVEMEDGRVFFEGRGHNDTIAPHYVVLACKKTGVHFNVNLNNGRAYRTNL